MGPSDVFVIKACRFTPVYNMRTMGDQTSVRPALVEPYSVSKAAPSAILAMWVPSDWLGGGKISPPCAGPEIAAHLTFQALRQCFQRRTLPSLRSSPSQEPDTGQRAPLNPPGESPVHRLRYHLTRLLLWMTILVLCLLPNTGNAAADHYHSVTVEIDASLSTYPGMEVPAIKPSPSVRLFTDFAKTPV